MKVVIYGKPNCPWCDSAKDLVKDVKGIEYEYIDIVEAGINGTKLSEICGETVKSVPQIFVNGNHIPYGFLGLAPVVSSYMTSLAMKNTNECIKDT